MSKGFFVSVACNISIFKTRSYTLSIVDKIIFSHIPWRYASILKVALTKQVALLGFWKKVKHLALEFKR